jgi:hypothetical protein
MIAVLGMTFGAFEPTLTAGSANGNLCVKNVLTHAPAGGEKLEHTEGPKNARESYTALGFSLLCSGWDNVT